MDWIGIMVGLFWLSCLLMVLYTIMSFVMVLLGFFTKGDE